MIPYHWFAQASLNQLADSLVCHLSLYHLSIPLFINPSHLIPISQLFVNLVLSPITVILMCLLVSFCFNVFIRHLSIHSSLFKYHYVNQIILFSFYNYSLLFLRPIRIAV